MLNYIEKGQGLHQAIAKAGHWLRQNNAVWECSDEAAVQAIIDGYSLEQVALDVCVLIEAHAKALRDKAVAAVSPGEMASWPIKLAEAAKYAQTGYQTDAPLLTLEATARGITLDALCGKVSNNAAALASMEATIAGVCGKHRDAVRACTTLTDLDAYDWHTGWPEV